MLAGRIALDQGREASAQRYLAAASSARVDRPRGGARPRLARRGAAPAGRGPPGRGPGGAAGRRSASSRSTRPASGPPSCAPTSAPTGAPWRGGGCRWRWRTGTPVASWSGPSATGRARCGCGPARPPTTRTSRATSPSCARRWSRSRRPATHGTDDARLVQQPGGARASRPGPVRGPRAAGTGAAVGPRGPADDLAGSLGDAALVEFVERGGSVLAVTVAGGPDPAPPPGRRRGGPRRDGRTSLRAEPAGPPRPGASGGAAAPPPCWTAPGRPSTTCCSRPLLAAAGRPRLVVVPVGRPPVGGLVGLPCCVGRRRHGQPVGDPVAPGAVGPRQSRHRADGLGRGTGLPGARQEAQRRRPGCTRVVAARATRRPPARRSSQGRRRRAAAPRRPRPGARRQPALLVGRARRRAADGLRARGARRRRPATSCSSACDTGRAQAVTGEEVLGFGAALLAAGTVDGGRAGRPGLGRRDGPADGGVPPGRGERRVAGRGPRSTPRPGSVGSSERGTRHGRGRSCASGAG